MRDLYRAILPLAAVFLLFTPRLAHASPGGVSVSVPQQMIEGVPPNGILQFSGYAAGYGRGNSAAYLRFVVTDPQGQEVAGSHFTLVTEPEGWCCAEIMVGWQPDAPLAANTTYEGVVTVAPVGYSDSGEMGPPDWNDASDYPFSFRTGDFIDPANLGVEAVSIQDLAVEVEERSIEGECCRTDIDCPDGTETCQRCWATHFERYPTVAGTAILSEPRGWGAAWVFRTVTDDGNASRYYDYRSNPNFRVDFASDREAPYCVKVQMIHLESGFLIESEEVCVSPAAGVEFGEAQRDRPEYCLENSSPDAGADAADAATGDADTALLDAAQLPDANPDAQTADAAGEPADAGVNDAGRDGTARDDSTDEAAGCSQLEPGTAPVPLAFVLAALLLVRSRAVKE